jgi:hypothetical protein
MALRAQRVRTQVLLGTCVRGLVSCPDGVVSVEFERSSPGQTSVPHLG